MHRESEKERKDVRAPPDPLSRLLNRLAGLVLLSVQRRSAFRSSALGLFSSWLECDRTNQRPFEEARGAELQAEAESKQEVGAGVSAVFVCERVSVDAAAAGSQPG